jgi:hypothetical protein
LTPGSDALSTHPDLDDLNATTTEFRLTPIFAARIGGEIASWWIDAAGSIHDRPVAGAELLPGGFILPGLVDAHAHPAVGSGPAGLVALDEGAARAALIAWARAGVTLVRDVGSPGGVILELTSGPGMPGLQAAGRFLAPAGRYFPDLLRAGRGGRPG